MKPDGANDRLIGAVSRRAFMGMSGALLAGLALWRYRGTELLDAAGAKAGQPKMVKIVEFSDAGARGDLVQVAKVVKSEEWRQQLSPISFEVTRHSGTETAFTGQYWNLHDKGLFRCICCDTALFSSDTKFDSGTGWPSFWAPIAKENIKESTDLSLRVPRTAVSCRRCDSHLGHVFDDGPRPTGLRYCMNSASLEARASRRPNSRDLRVVKIGRYAPRGRTTVSDRANCVSATASAAYNARDAKMRDSIADIQVLS